MPESQKKPKFLPHHLGDRLGIHDQSVVSLPPFVLRRHTVVVLYDPSEKINKIKLYDFYNLHIHFSINISFNFYPIGRSLIMRSSVLIS